jgi:hypothetical protein
MRNVFITHGGPSFFHVSAVGDLLNESGFVPVIVQELPSFGLSVNEKVRSWMRICPSAIVLATADSQSAYKKSRTRQNIVHEIGMLQAMPTIQNRIVYLKEPGVQFSSNIAERCGSSLLRNVFRMYSFRSLEGCERSHFDRPRRFHNGEGSRVTLVECRTHRPSVTACR